MSQSSKKGNRHRQAISKARRLQLQNQERTPGFLSTAISRGFTPFPEKFNVKHVYAQTVQLTSGALGTMGTENVFCLTGMYDPDVSGVGHQPYGYDQLTPLYVRYLVKKVELEVRFMAIDGGGDDLCCAVALRASSNPTLTSLTVDQATEKPCISTKPLSPYGSTRVAVFRFTVLPWILLGITRQQYENNQDQYGAVNTTNPSVAPYLAVDVANYKSTGGISCQCQVVLKYHAQWYDRKIQSSS